MVKVSICIPVFNVEKFIEKSCRSLFEQTYPNIEYIFVDDCSQDDSINILQKTLNDYPNRKESVKIVRHNENKGLAAARNTGLYNSCGDYIMHIDSDDYIDTCMIEDFVNTAIREEADMVICNFQLEYGNKSIKQNHQYLQNKNDYIGLLLKRKAIVSIVARLIKRSVFEKMNVISVENINTGEDYVTTPRICYYCNKIVKVDKEYYHYVKSNTSSYTHIITKKSIDDVLNANKILVSFFSNKIDNKVLEDCKLINKICLLHVAAKGEYLSYVCSQYKDIAIWKSDLGLLKKILLQLSLWKFYFLIKLFFSFKRK